MLMYGLEVEICHGDKSTAITVIYCGRIRPRSQDWQLLNKSVKKMQKTSNIVC